MSAKIKPSFTVKGKHYEFYYSKAMQCEWQRMTDEKKNDKEYQRNVVEYSRLKSKYEKINELYTKAFDAFLENPTDKALREAYETLDAENKKSLHEFSDFGLEHPDMDEYKSGIDTLEQLVLYALQEQYKLSADEAKDVWCGYVEENGEISATKWLACFGNALFGMDDDDENPFVKAQMTKIEQAENRRIGMNKVNK